MTEDELPGTLLDEIAVELELTQDRNYIIVMPNGVTSEFTSLRAALKVAYTLQANGYRVTFAGEPLTPTTGVFGFLHRLLSRLEAYLAGKNA